MMGVVVNGPWPMSQSFNIQNEISGNLEKCYNSESSSSGGNGAAALNSQWLKKIKLVKRIKRKIGIGTRGGESSPNNLPALLFHSVHGENIQLICDGTIARRTNSFCNAITFSNRSVKINERVSLKLVEASPEWKGVLRFGFTNVDPATITSLPSYSIPNLTSKQGYWAKTFNESDTRFTGLNFKKDSILFYYVNQAGNVHVGINGDDKGVFFCGVDTRKPLWALIDVYGGTIALELVDTRTRLNNSRKSLNESVGNISCKSSSSRPTSRSKQHPSNELELKILSTMGSMSLKSDEQYDHQIPPPPPSQQQQQQWNQQGSETPYHHHHQHCRQRSVSCCQHYQRSHQNLHNHHYHCSHQNFEDDDEDLFQKPQQQQKIETCSSKSKLFQEVDGGGLKLKEQDDENNHSCVQQQQQQKKDKLIGDETFGFTESQLEVVCRRASLSPASFNLFHNKSTTNNNCNSSSCNNRRNNHNNMNNCGGDLNLSTNSDLKSSSPKIVSKSITSSKLNNNNNNNNSSIQQQQKTINNIMYVDSNHTHTTNSNNNNNNNSPRQRHQSMYQFNNNNNNNHNHHNQTPATTTIPAGCDSPSFVKKIVQPPPITTTCSSPLLPKINPNRFSYHCGTNNVLDNDYFEQQLLLAAANSSSPVSPASSSSTSSYVIVRGNEPIYTEVISNNCNNSIYNNSSCSSSSNNGYSYVPSPVMKRNESSQITPIYSTTFAPSSTKKTSSSTSSLKRQVQQSGTTTTTTASATAEPMKASSQKSLLHQWSVGCVSCYERPVNSIFYACGHMCMCYQCAFDYWTNKEQATCPICSTIISDVVIRSNSSSGGSSSSSSIALTNNV